MSIVTVEDLKRYMSSINIDSDQWAAAQDIIDGVEGEVEAFLGRSIQPVETTETVDVDRFGYLMVSNTPVTSVISVGYNNTSLPFSLDESGVSVGTWFGALDPHFFITPDDGYGQLDGLDMLRSPMLTYPVDITYVGGTPTRFLKFLRHQILRISAREFQNHHDDTLGIANMERDQIPREIAGLTLDDERHLSRLKRPMAF